MLSPEEWEAVRLSAAVAGRSVALSLTDRGEQALRETFRSHNRRETAWASALDVDERRTLAALLGKLADAAHAEGVRRRD